MASCRTIHNIPCRLKALLTTIEGLLHDGADPRRVNCPQPALAIAVAAQCPEVVRLMIKYGADAKEEYPQVGI